MKLENRLLCCKDGRLERRIWILIESVEVLIQSILSVVATINTIWVQTRYDLKHVMFPKKLRLFIISRGFY
jgi:hypothetical protein